MKMVIFMRVLECLVLANFLSAFQFASSTPARANYIPNYRRQSGFSDTSYNNNPVLSPQYNNRQQQHRYNVGPDLRTNNNHIRNVGRSHMKSGTNHDDRRHESPTNSGSDKNSAKMDSILDKLEETNARLIKDLEEGYDLLRSERRSEEESRHQNVQSRNNRRHRRPHRRNHHGGRHGNIQNLDTILEQPSQTSYDGMILSNLSSSNYVYNIASNSADTNNRRSKGTNQLMKLPFSNSDESSSSSSTSMMNSLGLDPYFDQKGGSSKLNPFDDMFENMEATTIEDADYQDEEAATRSRTEGESVQHHVRERDAYALRMASENVRYVMTNAQCSVPVKQCLDLSNNQTLTGKTYWPRCAIVSQCGPETGCCYSRNHVCTAAEFQIIEMYFFYMTIGAESRAGVDRLAFVNHTKCECRSKDHVQRNTQTELRDEPSTEPRHYTRHDSRPESSINSRLDSRHDSKPESRGSRFESKSEPRYDSRPESRVVSRHESIHDSKPEIRHDSRVDSSLSSYPPSPSRHPLPSSPVQDLKSSSTIRSSLLSSSSATRQPTTGQRHRQVIFGSNAPDYNKYMTRNSLASSGGRYHQKRHQTNTNYYQNQEDKAEGEIMHNNRYQGSQLTKSTSAENLIKANAAVPSSLIQTKPKSQVATKYRSEETRLKLPLDTTTLSSWSREPTTTTTTATTTISTTTTPKPVATEKTEVLRDPSKFIRNTCKCPEGYSPSFAPNANAPCECVCDVSVGSCRRLMKGKRYFKPKDNRCISTKECGVPACKFGSFDMVRMRCPKKREAKKSKHRN